MLVVESSRPETRKRDDANHLPQPTPRRLAEQAATGIIVFAPLVALAVAVTIAWGSSVRPREMVVAVLLYAITGHGITVGFHRLFAHRSFRAIRPVRVALAVAGSMAFEGPLIGWVADHRRHHAFTDRDGDPHSPHRYGAGFAARLRGLWHAHTGWLFEHNPTSQARYARDLLADRDLVVVDRLFPLWCGLSLAVPFALGWLLGGTLAAAANMLLWAGAVRICLLHHVTWSINSLCHTFGRRPYDTPDRSTNVAAMAVLSMGESFHNNHHAFPNSARHGLESGQLDSSAALIGWFAGRGWASDVRRPNAHQRLERAGALRGSVSRQRVRPTESPRRG